VGFNPCVGLVVDRADCQVIFEFLERLFHLDLLQVECPELCWIALRDIRPQQVTAFTAASFAQLLPVQLEAERLWCDGLIIVRQLKVDDPPGRRPGLFPGRPQLDQQLVAGQLLLAQLMQAFNPLPVPPDGIVTLISGRWRRSHLVDAPHHATHQAHVSCRQTLNASDRIAR